MGTHQATKTRTHTLSECEKNSHRARKAISTVCCFLGPGSQAHTHTLSRTHAHSQFGSPHRRTQNSFDGTILNERACECALLIAMIHLCPPACDRAPVTLFSALRYDTHPHLRSHSSKTSTTATIRKRFHRRRAFRMPRLMYILRKSQGIQYVCGTIDPHSRKHHRLCWRSRRECGRKKLGRTSRQKQRFLLSRRLFVNK